MTYDAEPSDLANKLWMKNYKIKLIKHADKPKLYMMAGLPLSGKTYLAHRILERSPGDVVYIENDLVRWQIIEELGMEKPLHVPEEHNLVYSTSHELIWLALSFSYHTIFDATNLQEKYRQNIYEIADAAGAEVLVIKTRVDYEIAKERSKQKMENGPIHGHSDADIKVHLLLDREDEDMEGCTRPYVVLDTSNGNYDELIDEHDLELD
jgi:predicted kinase